MRVSETPRAASRAPARSSSGAGSTAAGFRRTSCVHAPVSRRPSCHVARFLPRSNFCPKADDVEISAEFSVTLECQGRPPRGWWSPRAPRAHVFAPRGTKLEDLSLAFNPISPRPPSLFPIPSCHIALSLSPSLWTPGERPAKMKERLNYEKTVVYKLTIYR